MLQQCHDALAGETQALHHPPGDQVLFQDLIEIGTVDVGVPSGLGVHHQHRALRAPIEAAGSIDPDPAGARQPQLLGFALEVVTLPPGIALGATLGAVLPDVSAKKDVVFVIGHDDSGPSRAGDEVERKVTIGAPRMRRATPPEPHPDLRH
jgi:hypothetical protein